MSSHVGAADRGMTRIGGASPRPSGPAGTLHRARARRRASRWVAATTVPNAVRAARPGAHESQRKAT